MPESIKALLKMIRELKVQIDALDDRNLDLQARRLQLEALQSGLASLSSALGSTDASLIRLLRKNALRRRAGEDRRRPGDGLDVCRPVAASGSPDRRQAGP